MTHLKRDDDEHPVPDHLRGLLEQVAQAFSEGDFQLRDHSIGHVAPIAPATAEAIKKNVLAYGDRLAPLNPATWERSCYRWMDTHWQVLVDLTTAGEQVSDLTLHAILRDSGGLLLEVQSVHVP
mgnify:CR=1 FL=1